MLYFVLGFAVLGGICYLTARHQEQAARVLEGDPNLQYRYEKAIQTVKYLNAYGIGCGIFALVIFFMWLF
ncbi:MAG: hypothetical protein HUJ26_15055 [Planctomycetaceae bacterium]|nr:hypothetical protein [Planctomycetaceae bacterium]